MNGKCALCTKETELKLSHIIPKFVFRWLKESAPSAIRSIRIPNQRVQDGEKKYLLCSDCEKILNVWETTFCERVFLPLHDSKKKIISITYGPWALKFAVSVSWRVLLYFYQLDDLAHLSGKQRETTQKTLDVWRKFLLGELQNPGKFEQHLLYITSLYIAFN
jgi:hypothetical protein